MVKSSDLVGGFDLGLTKDGTHLAADFLNLDDDPRLLYLDYSASGSLLPLPCLSRERRVRAGTQDRLILHMHWKEARLEKLVLYWIELVCPASAGGRTTDGVHHALDCVCIDDDH